METVINKKRLLRSAVSAALCLALVLSSSLCSFAKIESGVQPEVDESYYVLLDPYGNLTDASIVKSFRLNGASEITDYGRYDSVTNLTDATKPICSDQTVQFHFGADAPTHFYFEGKTDAPFRALPFLLSLSYSLNGVPTEADQLPGKSGVVEIRVKAVPNPDSPQQLRNNWFLTAAAVFNQNDILSLEAPDAQMQTLGNIRTALFFWLPGEDQEYTLRIGTEDFHFQGLTFVMGPLNAAGRLRDLKELREAKEDSEASWDSLNEAADEILDSMDTMKGSLRGAADGLRSLDRVRSELHRNKPRFDRDLDGLLSDLEDLSSRMTPISGHLSAVDNQIGDMRNGLNDLNQTLQSLKTHLEETQSTLGTLNRDMGKLKDNSSDLDRDLHHVKTDIKRLRALGDDGKRNVEQNVKGTLSQMTKLYRGYAAYMKAQGLAPLDAIGDGSVQYDLDSGGHATQSNAGAMGSDLSYRGSGNLSLTGISYPEGSFQAFAIEKLTGMGCSEAQIAYAIAVWGNREAVGKAAESAGRAYDGAGQLADDLAGIGTEPLSDLMTDLGSDGQQVSVDLSRITGDLSESLAQIDRLHTTADSVLADLHPALDDAAKLSDSIQQSVSGTSDVLRTSRDILRENSRELNRGTRQSLSNTADLLGQSADTLDSTDKLRTAKQTLQDLVDDKWKEYTGERNHLFCVDAEAEPASLTSGKNHVRSVSVLIRTAELKEAANDTHLTSEDDEDHRNLLQRIVGMFTDLWHALTGWTRK